MKEFTIYKDKWVRGNGYFKGNDFGSSALLNKEGNMCCLGFLGEACGISRARMLNLTSPFYVDDDHSNHNYPDVVKDWSEFILVNDNKKLTDRQRQDRLRRMFKNIGYKVSFKKTASE